jgi:translation initiation factor 1 (eIF-1/SUI1)
MPKKPTKTRERNLAGKAVAGEGAPPPQAFSLADFVTALPGGGAQFPALGGGPGSGQDSSDPPVLTSPAGRTAPPADEAKPPAPTFVPAPVAASATPTPVPVPAPAPAPAYTIMKTKKGGLPVRVESRGKGKKVTVVFNVTGDLRLLLTQLKQAAGSGGVVRDDTVEIQGEKVEFVERFIRNKMKK